MYTNIYVYVQIYTNIYIYVYIQIYNVYLYKMYIIRQYTNKKVIEEGYTIF